MAKRNLQSQPKLFDLNLESLIIFDESQDEQNDSQASSTESCGHSKKFRNKGSKPLPVNKIKTTDANIRTDGIEKNKEDQENMKFNDVSKFFENVGNDFGMSMKVRKTRLSHFTDAVIMLYKSKITEIVKRQKYEVEEFKQRVLDSVQEKLNKGEEELKKLKVQEIKIVKSLEQRVKLFQKTATNLEALIENYNEVHKNFIQAFEDLKKKHRNEALELKQFLGSEMFMLQNEFLAESKEEEMQTVEKYLSAIYF